MAGKFEAFIDADLFFRFRLLAADGGVIAVSGPYEEFFLKTRNPPGSVGDYPYEVPVWNLSPITFQTGSFVFPHVQLPPA
ncbi:hypothetical protein [Arthrobacter sp. FW306-06-A]|uniref:hypothetical protein n=1 Tax=Arthrobacter sp. FW306-06-A TaxID=2879621 RepID=UPI001F19C3D4|nr:hypothetical protein [Arthrobacter sp. FW306-06-A]UKA71798.1 hypothetical protein LFT49_03360 [Arthrobacter sp. FW306-06-A]